MATPGIPIRPKKQPGLPGQPLPAGWQKSVVAKNLRDNEDGTYTVRADIILISPSGDKYSSGEQTHRMRKVKD